MADTDDFQAPDEQQGEQAAPKRYSTAEYAGLGGYGFDPDNPQGEEATGDLGADLGADRGADAAQAEG